MVSSGLVWDMKQIFFVGEKFEHDTKICGVIFGRFYFHDTKTCGEIFLVY